MFTHQHRGLFAAIFAVLAALAVAVPVTAAGAADTPYELQPGWVFLGAKATCPGAAARQFTGEQAAAFVESWYPASNQVGGLPEQKPPAALPKCTFVARDTINGAAFQFHALYVSQGDKAWMGLPPQEIGPGAFVPVQKWYKAHQSVKDAWGGTLRPINATSTTTTTVPTSTTKPASAADDDDSSNAAAWIIVGVAGVALLGVGGILVRRRRAG
jgi:hypothetical protein